MILVTGGAGYIGSHTCIELIQSGFDVLVLDNLSNSSPESLKRVEQITGKPITFIRGDVRDKALMKQLFDDHAISSVIHFAGLKAVGESVSMPLEYYDNNIGGTLALLEAMADSNCRSLVFSSSATVYGDPHTVPIREDFPLSATNPYGRSKLIIEEILKDLYLSDNAWNLALLRYFNPVGAHESGLIGEDPNGPPNNLMPVISQVAIGRQKSLNVFGGDYPTPDGTGVRDYIHVVDLARGHVTAVQKLQESPGLLTINLGTGQGYSVLEMVRAFEAASGRKVPYQIVERRPGDVATCYADPSYAREVLDWEAERNLQQMCEDAWRWQSMNPNGYAT
jgi:UDP-glucose 4-epimerase